MPYSPNVTFVPPLAIPLRRGWCCLRCLTLRGISMVQSAPLTTRSRRAAIGGGGLVLWALPVATARPAAAATAPLRPAAAARTATATTTVVTTGAGTRRGTRTLRGGLGLA